MPQSVSYRIAPSRKEYSAPKDSDREFGTSPSQHVLHVWWIEIIACVLATVAVFAIVVTLYPHQGKPLPQWRFKITINALVSIYTVVLKVCVAYVLAQGLAAQKWHWFKSEPRVLFDMALYDEATRGPLGAVRLLWEFLRRSLGRPILPSLGCLLVVVTIFVDPFAQLVIQTEQCAVSAQLGTAQTPRSNLFSYDGNHVGAGLESIWTGMQQAVSAGVIAPGGQVEVSCSTGNCSFPSFDTVGYCSSCKDVSHQITIEQCDLKLDNETQPQKVPFKSCTKSTLPDHLPIGYDASNLKLIQHWEDTGLWNLSVLAHVDAEYSKYQILIGPVPDADFYYTHQGLAKFGPLDAITGLDPLPCNFTGANETWRCRGWGAATCQLYPCVRSYSASMKNGVYRETLVDETPEGGMVNGNHDGELWVSALNVTCPNKDERHSLTALGYELDQPNTTWIPYKLTDNPDNLIKESKNGTLFPGSLLLHGCVFIVDYTFVSSLPAVYMNEVFSGILTGGAYLAPENPATDNFTGPPILETIYNAGDTGFSRVSTTFKNVSDSISTHMRVYPLGDLSTTGGSPSADIPGYKKYAAGLATLTRPATGSVLHEKTCLQVRWPWLALPASLVLFTIVYLALVLYIITGSSLGHVQAWKSSPLPLLFYGVAERDSPLAEESMATESGPVDIDVLESWAKEKSVQLLTDDNGLFALYESKE